MIASMEELGAHRPKHDFLIAVDSDGCVFDTMEIKQKECFVPNTVKHFGLQAVSKYCREAEGWLNLYSKWRGSNRFPALVKLFDLLEAWDVVQARGVQIPEAPNLRKWVCEEPKLGNPALEDYCKRHSSEEASDMHVTLAWSRAVSATIADMVQGGMPAFPFAPECLQKAATNADIMVCSQTPQEDLLREWEEQGLAGYVVAICGQEMGTKEEHIRQASQGHYEDGHVLMVGDALGDLKAARESSALFYPIVPGREQESWKQLLDEALDMFFQGSYAGAYEARLVEDFEQHLPSTPPWIGGKWGP